MAHVEEQGTELARERKSSGGELSSCVGCLSLWAALVFLPRRASKKIFFEARSAQKAAEDGKRATEYGAHKLAVASDGAVVT